MKEPSRAEIAKITATRCCVCRARLTDAESVEYGIGPICSRRYYNPHHKPTEQMIKDALGLLFISKLPDHIIKGFMSFINNAQDNRHDRAREACNLLIYWASCHYDNREEVFKCSKIIRALGYAALADKLEFDRTVAIIREHSDHIEAYIPNKAQLLGHIKWISGATQITVQEQGPLGQSRENPKKIGSKVGWRIPADQKEYFMAVLGFHCGGELACGTAGIQTIPHKKWIDIHNFRYPPNGNTVLSALTSSGKTIRLEQIGDKIKVFAPYNQAFKDNLKLKIPWQDRQWTGECWEVHASHAVLVKDLIKIYFSVRIP